MPLTECRLCGNIFIEGGRKNICPNCQRRLIDLYAVVHEYMRDNQDEEFDLDRLCDELNISPLDVQALIDLGYIERDLGLYGKKETERSALANAFSNELDKMRSDKKMFYGGEVYARDRAHFKTDGLRTVRKR